MRKIITLSLFGAALSVSLLLTSFTKPSDKLNTKTNYHGPMFSMGVTGNSVNGCGCHGPIAAGVGVSVTGIPANPEVGISYPLQFVVTGPKAGAGFDLTVGNGALTSSDANVSVASTTELTHSSPKAAVAGQVVFNFNWTPATVGLTTFNYSGNNIDFSGGTGGDSWNRGSVNTSVVVPVKIISFSAMALNNNEHYLQWNVAQESQILRYEIEQSCDGAQFNKVGSVASGGQFGANNRYSFTSILMNCNAKAYYRLKVIEANGTDSYSAVVAVNANKVNNIQLLKNPVSIAEGEITIKIDQEQVKSISLINEAGMIVQNYAGSQNKIQQLSLPTGIKAGLYTVVVRSAKGSKSLQVLVQ